MKPESKQVLRFKTGFVFHLDWPFFVKWLLERRNPFSGLGFYIVLIAQERSTSFSCLSQVFFRLQSLFLDLGKTDDGVVYCISLSNTRKIDVENLTTCHVVLYVNWSLLIYLPHCNAGRWQDTGYPWHHSLLAYWAFAWSWIYDLKYWNTYIRTY